MEIKTYDKAYFKKMLDLTKSVYEKNNDICDENFINHEYFNNPCGDASVTFAIDTENDNLMGQYVIIPINMRCFGNVNQQYLSLNTITNEKYRGKGVFTKLACANYNLISEKSDICYGMPNQNSYPGFVKKLEFKDICDIPLYLKPVSLSVILKSFIGKSSNIFKILNIFVKPRNAKTENIIEIDSSKKELVETFCKEIQDKYPIMVQRDYDFIKYRYLDIPKREYKVYQILENDKPVAMVITRITEVSGIKSGMIVDALCANDKDKSLRKLIKHAIYELYTQGAGLVGSLMLEHTQESKILKSLGFIKCPKFLEPQPFKLIVRNFNNDSRYYDIKNWFFTMGDYDVI